MNHSARSQESAFGERKYVGERPGGSVGDSSSWLQRNPVAGSLSYTLMVCVLCSLLSLRHSSHLNTSSLFRHFLPVLPCSQMAQKSQDDSFNVIVMFLVF